MTEVAENLGQIKQAMAAASERSGRSVDAVSLVAVSKTWPVEHVQLAVDAGQMVLGENKLQEGQVKIPAMDPAIEWHYIGGLQRNKVRKVFGLFQYVHSIDSMKLARYADGVAADMGIVPRVLLQVNIGGELSKGGFELDEIRAGFSELVALEHLEVRGLMCIPPAVADPDQVRPFFRAMVHLKDELETKHGVSLPELSMGMSGDFEVAIEEGATMVRVGSSIFGARNYSPR
ncbi:YggS family pyridoxal phosphate-dependent enzyme [Rubritalea marina]|uniref:YggS family pyridoxal phosphate-dependent enzyme n=1 Tax=Rubritalea marina TaxID=361055 RepID=UPI00037C4797|nr:YggS family pyridoxal phosphate-dependent enzyme [Rubritalea marina]